MADARGARLLSSDRVFLQENERDRWAICRSSPESSGTCWPRAPRSLLGLWLRASVPGRDARSSELRFRCQAVGPYGAVARL